MTENRASEEFGNHAEILIEEDKRRFVNMREAMIDVLVELERQGDLRFTKKLKKRALESRSMEELRFVMDGMLVLAGFAVRPTQ